MIREYSFSIRENSFISMKKTLTIITLSFLLFSLYHNVQAGLIFKAPSSIGLISRFGEAFTPHITQKPPCGGIGDPISVGVKTWYLSALYQYYKDCQVGACG